MSFNLKSLLCGVLHANHEQPADITGEGYAAALPECVPAGGAGGGSGSGPIQKIVSATDNMVVLRDLESGTYVLQGRFVPYAGADSTMNFSSSLLVNLIKRTDDTQIQIFYPVNNCVQYLKITDSTYERKDVYLNDLAAAAAE